MNCYQEGKRECKWPCGWFPQWRMPWASCLCLNSELHPPLREQQEIAKTELKQARARKGQEGSLRVLSQLPPKSHWHLCSKGWITREFCENLLKVILCWEKKSILNPFCYCARSWKSFLATKFSDKKVWDLIGTSVLWDGFLLCKYKLSKVNVWSVWYLKILFSLDIWNCLWGKMALCTILNV